MEVIKEIFKYIVTFIKEWGELLISAVAFIVSIVAMKKASKSEEIQNKINELELQIKQHEIDKIKEENELVNNTCVEARVITIGKGKHRMKVWNSGNATVYNVTATFEGTPGIIIMDREKQPFDELESGKGYELVLVAYGNHNPKFKIITEWEDENGEIHSKVQMGDL